MRTKFEPSSAPDCLMLKEELLGMKQAKFQNPEEFITELEDKVLEYQTAGGTWNDRETLEHICGNVQKCYESVVQPLEKRIDDTDKPLTLRELKQDLIVKFTKLEMRGSRHKSRNEGEEIGLFAGGFK